MAPPPALPFFCHLCRKGYARISELEVHESSYDHHHRKRAVDLRLASRDVSRRDKVATQNGAIRVLGEDESRVRKKKGKRDFKAAFDGKGVNDTARVKRQDSIKTTTHETDSKTSITAQATTPSGALKAKDISTVPEIRSG